MDSPNHQPGIHHQVLEQRNQFYTIAIPANYTGEQAVPLVMALHYGGPVTRFFGEGVLAGLVEPALRELGAIIVAPDCQHKVWTNPQSETEILELLAFLQSNYAIDPSRTLITGYSLGGGGTWYMAARNQDKFAAALPIAGWPQPDSAQVKWKIPLYVIHSRDDEVVPFDQTERAVQQLRDKGAQVEWVLLQDITHYETDYFIEPLRQAVPWIKKVWGENPPPAEANVESKSNPASRLKQPPGCASFLSFALVIYLLLDSLWRLAAQLFWGEPVDLGPFSTLDVALRACVGLFVVALALTPVMRRRFRWLLTGVAVVTVSGLFVTSVALFPPDLHLAISTFYLLINCAAMLLLVVGVAKGERADEFIMLSWRLVLNRLLSGDWFRATLQKRSRHQPMSG